MGCSQSFDKPPPPQTWGRDWLGTSTKGDAREGRARLGEEGARVRWVGRGAEGKELA